MLAKIFGLAIAAGLFIVFASLFHASPLAPREAPAESRSFSDASVPQASSSSLRQASQEEKQDTKNRGGKNIPPESPPRAVHPFLSSPAPMIPFATSSAGENTQLAASTSPLLLPPMPPLDEDALMRAVVKIECPFEDGIGKYSGSGFVLGRNAVFTAAHVVISSGADTCAVIFPRERRPAYFLKGTIDKKERVKQWYEENGIDVAMLTLPELDAYPEGRAIFERYPSVPYPLCRDPRMLGDNLLHFGYPSNYADQSYLSRLDGRLIAYAAVAGMREALSEDQTFTYRAPAFASVSDQEMLTPYMVSQVASFYGDSGGLAFNASKQCVLGPHHGGTAGKSDGANYTLFSVLGWEGIEGLESLYQK